MTSGGEGVSASIERKCFVAIPLSLGIANVVLLFETQSRHLMAVEGNEDMLRLSLTLFNRTEAERKAMRVSDVDMTLKVGAKGLLSRITEIFSYSRVLINDLLLKTT